MSWLLNTIYVGFLIASSPWMLWRYFRAGKNRRGWSQKLFGLVPTRKSENKCIWMHAVSVGEVNLLTPILKALHDANPELDVAISTTTETGFDLAVEKYPQHIVFFCPLDFTWAIKRAINRIRPAILVLVELEVWPNLIATTRSAGIPVAVVNGRLSENSMKGYRRLRWLLRQTFENLDLVAVQNQSYADRFLELGCDPANVIVTGNVKFDGVETDRENARTTRLAKLANIAPTDKVWIAGSTQLEEDLLAARVYQQLCSRFPDLRLILVPRHPERTDLLVKHLKQLGIPTIRRSKLLGEGRENHDLSSTRAVENDGIKSNLKPVLIVDVIGELGAWWGVASLGYVGGSMGRRGGQNMIEPAAFGIPVSFGPNTCNFQQLVDELTVHDAATVVHDEAELLAFVERVFVDQSWASKMGSRARNVVLSHVGASLRTAKCLTGLLQKSGTPSKSGLTDSKAA